LPSKQRLHSEESACSFPTQQRRNKYFFPGACGQKIIDMSHWLGATITSAEIIGTTGITPVRALIDDSAALIPAEKLALCVVTAEVADAAADSGVDQTVPAAAAETPAGTNSSLRSVSFGAPQQDKPMSAELAHPTTVDTTVGTPESFALLVEPVTRFSAPTGWRSVSASALAAETSPHTGAGLRRELLGRRVAHRRGGVAELVGAP
jgi:hypothetical protein